MSISQGLVGPNQSHNMRKGKGKKVNIPLLFWYEWQHKHDFRRLRLERHEPSFMLTKINQWSIVMMRN